MNFPLKARVGRTMPAVGFLLCVFAVFHAWGQMPEPANKWAKYTPLQPDGMRFSNGGNGRHFVEVEFEERDGRFLNILWISAAGRGFTRDVPNWAIQGGGEANANSGTEAAECLRLLKSVEQPEHVPKDDPGKIVTVRCFDGWGLAVKSFPVDAVPRAVHDILAIVVGHKIDNREFLGMKFIQENLSPEEQKKRDIEDAEFYAEQQHASNHYTTEAEMWTQALALDPKNEVYLMKRAKAYAAAGQTDKMAEDCEAAIQLDPKDEEPYRLRAIAFRSKGMEDKAITALDAWIAFNPKSAEAYAERAERYIWKDDAKVVADCTVAINLGGAPPGPGRPKNWMPYSIRGEAYARLGEKEKAIADFTAAIGNAPNFAHYYQDRAGAYADTGQWDKAFADFDTWAKLSPTDLNAFMERGYAHYHRGEWDKAIADADEVLRIKDGWSNALVLRGNIYAAQGMYDKALADFNDTMQRDPQIGTGKNAAAWLYSTCPDEKYRDGAKALDLAMQACTDSQWYNDGWIDTLAAAYAESGKWQEAVDYEKLAIKVAGKNDKAVKIYEARIPLYERHKAYREEKGVASDN